jgi:hypothetical protein
MPVFSGLADGAVCSCMDSLEKLLNTENGVKNLHQLACFEPTVWYFYIPPGAKKTVFFLHTNPWI